MPSEPPSKEVVQIPVPQDSFLGLPSPMADELIGYGGFVASILVLCLFFRVLTEFVKGVKED